MTYNRFQFAHRYRPAGPLKLERSYNFTDKVTVVDELRTLAQNSGLTIRQLSDTTGLSYPCIWNLFHGKTQRPQRPTLEALARVFGKRVGLVALDLRLH